MLYGALVVTLWTCYGTLYVVVLLLLLLLLWPAIYTVVQKKRANFGGL